jgi:hypothetical protein
MSKRKWKILIWSSITIIIIVLSGYYVISGLKESLFHFASIDKNNVESVKLIKLIRKQGNSYQDTINISTNLANNVIKLWNQSIPLGLCKFLPEYELQIIFKNQSIRNFRIVENTMKENNDYCFKLLCSKNYFDELIQNQK